jgi:hypothetical protein
MAERASIVIAATDATAGAFSAVQGRLQALGAQSQSVVSKFAGFSAAIGGLVGAAGIGALFQQTVQGLTALNDVADATGAAIDKLGGLENVAVRTGTSFETVSGALIKLNQGLNAATKGSDLERTLRAIGLSAEQLRQQDPADALVSVAQALGKFADDGNKARVVQELFGRSVREVAPLLKNLAENGVQAATGLKEQADAAEQFSRALLQLRKDSTDASRDLAGEVLPTLTRVVEALRDSEALQVFGKAIRTAVQAIAVLGANVSFVFQGVGREIGAIGAQIIALAKLDITGFRAISEAVREDARRARAELDAFERRVLAAKQTITIVGSDFSDRSRSRTGPAGLPSLKVPDAPKKPSSREAVRVAEDLQAAIRALDATNVAKVQDLQATLRRLLTFDTSNARVQAAIAAVTQELEELSPAFQAAVESGKAFEEQQKRLAELTGRSAAQQQTADLKLLDEAFFSGRISADEFDAGLSRVFRGLERLGEGVKPVAEKLSEFAIQAQRNIQDALGDTLFQTLKGNFDSIGRAWGDLMLRLAAQAAASRLGEALFGNGTAGSTGLLSNLFRTLFPARALGGSVMAGQPYLVGERGAELFVPRSSGLIVPNPSIGGVTINQTINVAAGASRSEVLAASQQAKAAAVAEIRELMRRGGLA